MRVSYNKLWKLLIDKNMSASELRKGAGIAPNTMTRMRKNQDVSLAVLERICNYIECDFGDLIEYVEDNLKLPFLQTTELEYLRSLQQEALPFLLHHRLFYKIVPLFFRLKVQKHAGTHPDRL